MNCALSKAREKGVARFLPNPEECWGPKPRAGRRITSKHTPSHGDMKLNGTPQSPKVVDGDNTSMDCEKETDKMMKQMLILNMTLMLEERLKQSVEK